MRKSLFGILTAVIFTISALGIGALYLFPSNWKANKHRAEPQARVVIPRNIRERTDDSALVAELLAREDSVTAKVPLAEGEAVISVLNDSFDGGPVEKQFVAYRNLLEVESPIYIAYIDYDEAARAYRRVWSAQTAATRPGTISLFTQDLLGDRSVCVLLSGVNGLGEHTLTIFRKNVSAGGELFSKIAEIRIDGTIAISEADRSQAYQMGFGRGQSYAIAAYGRDFESSNIMDQVEIIYQYNPGNGLYEQRNITRIPGTQIEQRRVRELLGNPKAFEDFITNLWYYVTPQGTIDRRQYIYFDPPSREIIFYGDETQQVFTWQNSTSTRYGLYIASQNISITTLRRFIDIELESLDSIKVKVFEDVRLNIKGDAPWDGSYRKAGPPDSGARNAENLFRTFIDASYDGPIGKIRFSPNGAYELNSGGTVKQGKYAFFSVDNKELLELRPEGGGQRETYLIEGQPPADDAADSDFPSPGSYRKTLTLLRVRIGARGIDKLNEAALPLSLSQ